MKLLLDDIYDVDKQLMMKEAYELIVRPMSLLTKQMMNGYHSAKYDALEEAIKRQDADIYLRGSY
jgi:arsenate reductase-like glutaredoxin family protein